MPPATTSRPRARSRMAGSQRHLLETFQKASAAFKAGRPAEAEQLCRQIVDADPVFVDAQHLLAIAQTRLGKAAEAVATYDRALILRPNDAEMACNRAVALLQIGRPADALASIDRALSLRPVYPQGFANRGLALV